MNSKERIRAIFNREMTDRVGFWLGNPADETKRIDEMKKMLGKDIPKEAHGITRLHRQASNTT